MIGRIITGKKVLISVDLFSFLFLLFSFAHLDIDFRSIIVTAFNQIFIHVLFEMGKCVRPSDFDVHYCFFNQENNHVNQLQRIIATA